MNDYIVRAKNVHKTYRQGRTKLDALRDIDIDIERGKKTLIIGPSGAGKSTLLHVMGGLDVPTIGTVEFDGKDFYALSDNRRSRIRNKKIGFVFQFYHLLPEFTALENVMLPAMIKGTRSKKKAQELLKAVGLSSRMRNKPRQLSGGEAQRVAIARALINDPEILLCDEPTGNLDSEKAGEIFDILYKANREFGKTLVVVSHDERIREDFDRVHYIRDGVMQSAKEKIAWV
jgi:lipoprotein-releasing system ATP-binding protein